MRFVEVPLDKSRVSVLHEGRKTSLSFLRSGVLAGVMPTHSMQSSTVYALYASREYLDAKIATWTTFLRDHIPASLLAGQSATKIAARELAVFGQSAHSSSGDEQLRAEDP
jgi:hypothetical protein